MSGTFSRWWSSRGGGAEVVKLALPMIISAGSLAIMQFADRVFLTWYDPVSVGASLCGGQFVWALASFPFSVAAYAVAFVSQYNGAKEYKRIGVMVWQGVFIGAAVFPLFFLACPFCDDLFTMFGHAEELKNMEVSYFFWSIWGIGAVISSQALESFFVGRKKMKTVMSVSVFAVLINVILDYLMIFGVLGVPRMGIAGAAFATSISQIIRFLIFLVLMIIDERRSKGLYGIRQGFRIVSSELGNLLKYGGMGGFQFFAEMISLSFFIFLLGKLGEIEATSSAIAFNLNALTFLPIVGMGAAVMTMVGNAIGEENSKLAKRSVFSAAAIGMTFTGFFMFLFLLIPGILLSAFAAKDPVSFAPYYEMTENLLRFVAVYLFFDTVNIIFCSAIKGAGDTWFVMRVTLVLVPCLVFFSWLGVHVFHFGVYWCWTVLTLYICVMGSLFLMRFIRGSWMSMSLMNTPKSFCSLTSDLDR